MNAADIDVSKLPEHAFGHRSIVWWGTVSFMVIEATVFAMLIAAYLYGAAQAPNWPPAELAPSLIFGTINTVILLASCWPNHKYKIAAERQQPRATRLWLIVALAFGVAFVVVRGFEFAYLNVRWDTNFYGSILWVLLGFHTVHILTDVIDTAVVAFMIYLHPLTKKRFGDVSDNGMYWYFVVVAWIPMYVLIYIVPHLT